MNRQWRLISRPKGELVRSDFEWREEPVPEPGEGQILVKNLFLSLDPTCRIWAGGPSYIPAVELGDVMRGLCVGEVVRSRNPAFREGAHLRGFLGWQDYYAGDGRGLHLIEDHPKIPLTAYGHVLGHVGMTAYFGLLDVGRPKAGETLVISGAAGATGSLVGQIGKIKGCRVVGIAGTDEKCQHLTRELGFDAAVNYKSKTYFEDLKAACPNGVDVFFDNVAGDVCGAVFARLNLRARVVLCGLISRYNVAGANPGPNFYGNILIKRARIEGFLVLDYDDRADEAITALRAWVLEGRVKYEVDVVDGLENAVEAFSKLFDGSNKGKLMVRV